MLKIMFILASSPPRERQLSSASGNIIFINGVSLFGCSLVSSIHAA